jgi:hypothetical protein
LITVLIVAGGNRMEEALWNWLKTAMNYDCDVAGLRMLWQGRTIWLLLGLLVFVNLLIPVAIVIRSFQRSITDRDFRP